MNTEIPSGALSMDLISAFAPLEEAMEEQQAVPIDEVIISQM